mmetsp:Transcript_89016/g.157648  ORF Transcript_89016/g.157648 Transcript_89016/m.157648 type:complete len:417 (+) Transcript_89016:52-1302(+)
MPKIVGGSERVVDTGLLTIDELAGNVASKEDRISIALVKISEATSEPWLTLHYDEWMCVLKGRMVLHFGKDETLEVKSGQTVFIAQGERFRPVFPDGNTEYIPVCLPAFRPDRCIREDAPDSAVAQKLHELHGTGQSSSSSPAKRPRVEAPEVLYHMCQKRLWEEAKKTGKAYFPPTFEKDGFTHATAVPSRLVDTANHFYQDVPGDWICLRFRRSSLLALGIVTKDEKAMPVGDKAVGESFEEWICPHVFGGLPLQVVDAEFKMLRDGPVYKAIQNLTDVPRRIFKLATGAEAQGFRTTSRIASTLDKKDGFVHLSDRTSAPKVAGLFFKDCKDLRLLELDSEKLLGSVNWVVGAMGDAEPDTATRSSATTVVHYLKPDGCVHVYCEQGVSTDAVLREVAVPLAEDGVHRFPDWL